MCGMTEFRSRVWECLAAHDRGSACLAPLRGHRMWRPSPMPPHPQRAHPRSVVGAYHIKHTCIGTAGTHFEYRRVALLGMRSPVSPHTPARDASAGEDAAEAAPATAEPEEDAAGETPAGSLEHAAVLQRPSRPRGRRATAAASTSAGSESVTAEERPALAPEPTAEAEAEAGAGADE